MKVVTPVRGTYDYPPIEAENREIIKQKILRSYQDNGFTLIETPILENLSLLDSSEGGDNLRLMFKTIKRGDKLDLTKPNLCEKDIVEEGLRYDLTVPLARFYACNREKLPNPFKAIQIGHSFRAERPQKGRNRQFIQCDIDIFGDSSINAETEIILTSINTLISLGLEYVTIKVNSRKILNSIIKHCGFKDEDINSICISLDKLDKIGISGVEEEIAQKTCQTIYTSKLMDAIEDIKLGGLCKAIKYGADAKDIEDIQTIINTVNEVVGYKAKCEFDLSIIRGQGYYTGTIYEAYAEGFKGAIGGGGRYDKMVGKLIGIDVPAVGFSIGFERVLIILSEQGKMKKDKLKIALIYDKEDSYTRVLDKKQVLMDRYAVSTYLRPKNMNSMLEKLKFANFDGYINMNDFEIRKFK
ncbi:MAG: ATP phosphoribosyltransferase regulatory subunit [Clostridia bacterium]|nr:ATP phosphoribosyltransferase regulatory subunit [Clostridia bacterium]